MSNSLYEYKQHEQNLGRLCIEKNTLERNYMKSADLIERDLEGFDRRISMAKSDIKREILKKQYFSRYGLLYNIVSDVLMCLLTTSKNWFLNDIKILNQ